MKVYIGPYLNYFGVSELVDRVFFWIKDGETDTIKDTIKNYLYDSWVDNVFQKIYSWRKRSLIIKIDNYDHWSADHTLAMIILPLLKTLQTNKQGAPFVDYSDVPDHLKPSESDIQQMADDPGWLDDKFFARWDYVISEMVWAFEQIVKDDKFDSEFYTYVNGEITDVDMVKLTAHNERIANGTILFGKYYQNLWS